MWLEHSGRLFLQSAYSPILPADRDNHPELETMTMSTATARKIKTYTITLSSTDCDNSKQASRDHLAQLIEQLPAGYLRDIIETEAPDFERAISDDICFIDYRAQVTAQQEHAAHLDRVNEEIKAARKELEAKQNEIRHAERRLDEIEQTRRELRKLLSGV
jgi:flagellar motility protein MotE (MotC chaperone)